MALQQIFFQKSGCSSLVFPPEKKDIPDHSLSYIDMFYVVVQFKYVLIDLVKYDVKYQVIRGASDLGVKLVWISQNSKEFICFSLLIVTEYFILRHLRCYRYF